MRAVGDAGGPFHFGDLKKSRDSGDSQKPDRVTWGNNPGNTLFLNSFAGFPLSSRFISP
jgi:hypothetical protein